MNGNCRVEFIIIENSILRFSKDTSDIGSKVEIERNLVNG